MHIGLSLSLANTLPHQLYIFAENINVNLAMKNVNKIIVVSENEKFIPQGTIVFVSA